MPKKVERVQFFTDKKTKDKLVNLAKSNDRSLSKEVLNRVKKTLE